MAGQVLREYQERGLAQILAAYREARSVLAVAPTGSGKTTVFSTLAAQVPTSVLILVHREELAKQARNRLREFGVPVGLIMSGYDPNPLARVQIASVQTLVRRPVPRAGLVIADEAHLSTAATWQKILAQYPRAKILGVTATPWRLSGKPLAGAYDRCVVVAHPAELRAQGHLCPYVGFSYQHPDLSQVDKVGDDYNQKQTGALMSAIVPNIVEQWLAHASNLSTVVFAATVEHSLALTEKFRDAGVTAEHLDGSTPKLQREAILARVERGETRVLCNVGVAVEGLDIPRLKCCVLARPTMSLSRAIQMMGRVRRPWQGVTARIHDHAFIIAAHGLPDADRDYLMPGKPEAPPALRTCKQCLAMYEAVTLRPDGSHARVTECPSCGAAPEVAPRGERQEMAEVEDAVAFEFSSDAEPAEPQPEERVVELKWTAPRTITGRYLRNFFIGTDYGPRTIYEIAEVTKTGRVTGKKWHAPGTMQLDRAMGRVPVGALARIAYTGERIIGERSIKEFRVAVDDGNP